jgi:tRNA A-37 threonylcarbamoyl transferase component Bud32
VGISWSSKRCWIDKKYDELFCSASLSRFDDLFRKDLGKTVRVEDEKSIRFFEISHAGGEKGFYIKREFPRWHQVIKQFLIHRRGYTLASSHELQLIKFYNENKIPVVVPVAWGERCILGVPVSGFLVQKEVLGQEFTELMKNGSSRERIELMKAYGKLIAELHSKGIISSFVRVTDLICTSTINKEWHEISLVIIDREQGKLGQEEFTFDRCVYYLSFILKRFFVYVGEPKGKEVTYFLKTYLEHLTVETKPDFRKLFFSVNCQR